MISHPPLWRDALRRHGGRVVAVALAAGCMTALGTTAAQAATTSIVVASTDYADLKAAVEQANALPAGSGPIVITFADGVAGEVALTGTRMNPDSVTPAGSGQNYMDAAGSWLWFNANNPVTLDFGGDVSLSDSNDGTVAAAIAISSPDVTITNFENILAAEAGIVVAAANATISHGTMSDPTVEMETGVGLTDGADGTVIDDVTTESLYLGVYFDDRTTAKNTTITNSRFANDGFADLWVDNGVVDDETEVLGLTVADTTFSGTGITGNVVLEGYYTVQDASFDGVTFDGVNEEAIYAGPFGTTNGFSVTGSTFTGTSYGWSEGSSSTHTGLAFTGNTFDGNLRSALLFNAADHVDNVVTGNLFADLRGDVEGTIEIPRSAARADAGNVIDGNRFIQGDGDGVSHNRWGIWAPIDVPTAGADGGWAFTRNHFEGYFGSTEAPITIGSSTTARTKAWGNTFGAGTRGSTVAAETEAGAAWFVWNNGNSNSRIQTWRPTNAVFQDGVVSFDVAPVVPALSNNQQPTPPLTLHVYWTATDKAEEYLGAIEDVTAAGRVSIPTTHADGYIRVQTEGGESGYVSQYSGSAKLVDKGTQDDDGDGLSNAREQDLGTDPTKADTDGDGIPDGAEAARGTDPRKADSDGDGIADGAEVAGPIAAFPSCTTDPLRADSDGDGLADGTEIAGIDVRQTVYTGVGKPRKGRSIGVVRTNPCAADTDADGLSDFREVTGNRINQRIQRPKKFGGFYKLTTRRTNPLVADTDRDGLTDKQEVTGSANKKGKYRKSDPTRRDSDWGGGADGAEVRKRNDPTRIG